MLTANADHGTAISPYLVGGAVSAATFHDHAATATRTGQAMTTAITSHARYAQVPAGHYRFRHAARMEWIKLRSLRSSWWTLAVTIIGAVTIGVTVGVNTKSPNGDVTNNALAGMIPGLLLAGVLGVLTMTGEYTSGLIRPTLAAVPRRPLVLAAKAAVLGAVLLAAGEAAAFLSFFAGGLALGHGIPAPSLGNPGVLRAVALSGASFVLIGLLGLGLGAVIRHTAAAVTVLVGGVYVAAQFIGAIAHRAMAYMPILIVGNSLSTTKPEPCGGGAMGCPHFLSAWAGVAVLCGYAVLALAAGGWLLVRRDA
jgi:ABC-2 type transport system permease protein